MNQIVKLVLALAGLCIALPAAAQAPTAEQKAREKQLVAILDSLHPVSGDVAVPQASAVLHLGKDYYYLPADEARRVLVDGWGNPPQTAEGVLGLVFPAGKTFLDDVWGAVITYEPTGYVTDKDATSTDYDELIQEMREGTEAVNEERTRQGYPAQHLVGWAQAPTYDPRSHSLVWAKNVRFEGQTDNTLSYDVRLLGRKGVLSLNMITGMSKLPETRQAAAKFAGAAEFQAGSRYADYQAGTDKKAEYGVAGLIAAGAGVAVAKKVGLIGIILAFGKKFLVLIVALFAGLGAWFRRKFGGGEPEQAYEPAAYDGLEEAQDAAPADPGMRAGPDDSDPRPA
ncbi:MAG TPA: DUF2167 domain-containing protein [Allosphingosinicella sp.]|jgi:uncharacterized membrane-anchored protein|nr:DUF2167 domain-containing protein [Allosphingosinicella sp.]